MPMERTFTPAREIGRESITLDLIRRILHLHISDYHIPWELVLEILEQAIGRYENHRKAAWVRTPLVLMERIIDWSAMHLAKVFSEIGKFFKSG